MAEIQVRLSCTNCHVEWTSVAESIGHECETQSATSVYAVRYKMSGRSTLYTTRCIVENDSTDIRADMEKMINIRRGVEQSITILDYERTSRRNWKA